MEPTGEPQQPSNAMIIDTAGLNPAEREVAFAVATNVSKPLIDAVASLQPGVRPYAIAVGALQAANTLLHERPDVFGPGPADQEHAAKIAAELSAGAGGPDAFPLIKTTPLSAAEQAFAVQTTGRLMETVFTLNQLRPNNVRPYALLVAVAELFKVIQDSKEWGPDNRVPGMPGPDGKPLD